MAEVRLSPAVQLAYDNLEKAGANQMLDAIDHALDSLEDDQTTAACRKRSFGGGLWGIPVRDRQDDWLIVWERDPGEPDIIRIRYLGADPFA